LKIKSVETIKLSIPLKNSENLSFGKVDRVDYNIVKVDTGRFVGFGEAATLQGPRWSEESKETIDAIIRKYLARLAVGQDTSEYQKIIESINENVKGNSFAKAALEMAILDVYGKELELPVYSLLGGKYRDEIPLSWTIANNDPQRDAKEASSITKKGWRILKLKVGSLPLKGDLERIRAARNAVGNEISLRIDVNQGWRLDQALSAIDQLKKEEVDFIEQPLPRWDLSGAAILASRSSIPIMADESLCDIRDAVALIKEGAAGAFSFKLTKMAGITNSRIVYSIARAHRISSYIGCMIETSIGTAAYLHFAASLPQLEYGCELFGPLRISDDLVSESKGIKYGAGSVFVPQEAGLGIKVDEDKINKLSESE